MRVVRHHHRIDDEARLWDADNRSGILQTPMSAALDRLAADANTTPAAASTITAFADWIRTRAAAGDLIDYVNVGKNNVFAACACCGLCPQCHQAGAYNRSPIQGCHACSECQTCHNCGQCACDVGKVVRHQPTCRSCIWADAQKEARERLADYERRQHDPDIKFALSGSNVLHLPGCHMLARSGLKDLEHLAHATDERTYVREHVPWGDRWRDDECMVPAAPRLLTRAQGAAHRGKRCRTCAPVA